MVPLRVVLLAVVLLGACTRQPSPDGGVRDEGGDAGQDAGSAGGGDGGMPPDAGSCGGFGGGSSASITSATPSYDFGAAAVGTQSATAVVTLDIRQTTFTTSVVGPDSAAFIAVPQGCFPTSASGVDFLCPISVTFSPARGGPANAVVAFNGTANAGFCLPVTGIGVDAGVLELAPPSLAFDAGTEAALTLTNHGSSATGAVAASLTGSGAGFFALSQDGCSGAALAASASCQLSVRFVPGADAGTRTAALRVDSASAGTAVAQLRGVATTPGMLIISSGIHDFGSASVDGGGNTFDFTVSNVSGAAAGPLTPASLTGAYAADFAIASDGCSTIALQPGQSCSVSVRFVPRSPGVKTARLAIANASTSLFATLVGTAQ